MDKRWSALYALARRIACWRDALILTSSLGYSMPRRRRRGQAWPDAAPCGDRDRMAYCQRRVITPDRGPTRWRTAQTVPDMDQRTRAYSYDHIFTHGAVPLIAEIASGMGCELEVALASARRLA